MRLIRRPSSSPTVIEKFNRSQIIEKVISDPPVPKLTDINSTVKCNGFREVVVQSATPLTDIILILFSQLRNTDSKKVISGFSKCRLSCLQNRNQNPRCVPNQEGRNSTCLYLTEGNVKGRKLGIQIFIYQGYLVSYTPDFNPPFSNSFKFYSLDTLYSKRRKPPHSIHPCLIRSRPVQEFSSS